MVSRGVVKAPPLPYILGCLLRPGGGVNPNILYFLSLDICGTPSYQIFRMGSISQRLLRYVTPKLAPMHFFGKMYGKSGKNISILPRNWNKSHQIMLWTTQNLDHWCKKIVGPRNFSCFGLFCPIFGQKWGKISKFHQNLAKRQKNDQIKNSFDHF